MALISAGITEPNLPPQFFINEIKFYLMAIFTSHQEWHKTGLKPLFPTLQERFFI